MILKIYSMRTLLRSPQFSRKINAHAFSLVEVVIALGVATFCLVTLVALIPTGLKSDKESFNESHAVNILSGIINERRLSSADESSIIYQGFQILPEVTSTQQDPLNDFFGVDLEGKSTIKDLSLATYRVDYTINTPISPSLGPYRIHIRISWPAQGTVTSALETTTSIPQP
jgi:uncharacterized protein (TIGR02598 family)